MGELIYFERILNIGSILNPNELEYYKKKLFDRSYQEPNTGCWIWGGDSVKGGYGRFQVKSNIDGSPKKLLAHRLSYYLYKGDIKKGFVVHHKCNNPTCVNPEHLDSITQYDNTMLGESFSTVNSRKTECPKGHPYNEKNTFHHKDGRRECRKCMNDKSLKRYYDKIRPLKLKKK